MDQAQFLAKLDATIAALGRSPREQNVAAQIRAWDDIVGRFMAEALAVLDSYVAALTQRGIRAEATAGRNSFAFALTYPDGVEVGFEFVPRTPTPGYEYVSFAGREGGRDAVRYGGEPDPGVICSRATLERRVQSTVEIFLASAPDHGGYRGTGGP